MMAADIWRIVVTVLAIVFGAVMVYVRLSTLASGAADLVKDDPASAVKGPLTLGRWVQRIVFGCLAVGSLAFGGFMLVLALDIVFGRDHSIAGIFLIIPAILSFVLAKAFVRMGTERWRWS